jgi:hypothetical protein
MAQVTRMRLRRVKRVNADELTDKLHPMFW